MDQHKQTFQEQLDSIRLTPQEKAAMRARLSEAMRESPVQAPARPAPSPYVVFFAAHRFMGAVAALLIVAIVGGTGTAYAAQGALPGDLLYPIKVNVTEQVETALASTPAQKAQVHVALAQKRLEEAQALAAQGKLNATTTAQIAMNLDAHAAAAQSLSQELAPQDPGESAQISAQLSSTLAANDAVLAAIADRAKDEGTRASSAELAMRVRALAASSGGEEGAASSAPVTLAVTVPTSSARAKGNARTALMAPAPHATSATETLAEKATSTEDHGMETAAAKIEARASEQLAQARGQFATLKGSLDASTAAELESQFSSADVLIENGSSAVGSGDYRAAMDNFTSALRKAVSLNAYLRAGLTFTPSILEQVLGGHVEGVSASSSTSDVSTSSEHGEEASSSVESPAVKGVPTSQDVEEETHTEVQAPVHIELPRIHL